MYGTINLDKLCRLLERIASEEKENTEVTITIIPEDEQNQVINKTA